MACYLINDVRELYVIKWNTEILFCSLALISYLFKITTIMLI